MYRYDLLDRVGKFSYVAVVEGRKSRNRVEVLERLSAGGFRIHFGRQNGASWLAFRLLYDVSLLCSKLVR